MRKKIVSDDFERLYRNQVFVIEKKKKKYTVCFAL